MVVPRRFFVALAAGLLLSGGLWIGLFYCQLGVPTDSSFWCYEMNRRKLESAARITAPKLLLVGGSGTLFGVKAQHLEEALGLPVLNLGTHAALGTEYLLRFTRRAIRPGDTVLLILEYELYEWGPDNKRAWAGDIYADYLMARDPQSFRALPWRDQIELIMFTPAGRLKRGLIGKWHAPSPARVDKFSIYNPDLVDAHGDLTGHMRARVPATGLTNLQPSQVLIRGLAPEARGLPVIVQFCRWAQDNNVRVLATFPNVVQRAEYDAPPARQTFARLKRFYASVNVPVIGDPAEAMFPSSDAFNTSYHPIEEVAQARTQRLVAQLAPLFPNTSKSAARAQLRSPE